MLKKIAKISVTLGLLGLMIIPNVTSKAVNRNILDKHHKWTTEQIACGYNTATGHTVLHLKDLNKIKVEKNGNKICIMLYPNYENASGDTKSAVNNPKYNGYDMKFKNGSWNGNNGLIKAKINSGMSTKNTFEKYYSKILNSGIRNYMPFRTEICGKTFKIKKDNDFKKAMKWYFMKTGSINGSHTLDGEARIAGTFAARTKNSLKGSSVNTAGIIKLTIECNPISSESCDYSYCKDDDVNTTSYDTVDEGYDDDEVVEGYVNPYIVGNGSTIWSTPSDRKVDISQIHDTGNTKVMEEIMDQIEEKKYTKNEIKNLKNKISIGSTNSDYKYEIWAHYAKIIKKHYRKNVITHTKETTTTYPWVYGQVKYNSDKKKWFIRIKDPVGRDNDYHQYWENGACVYYGNKNTAYNKMKELVESKSASHPSSEDENYESVQDNSFDIYISNEKPELIYWQEIKIVSNNPSYQEETPGSIGDTNNIIKAWSTKKVATTDDGYLNNSVKISGGEAKFTRKSNNCFSYTLTENMGIDTEKLAKKYNSENYVTAKDSDGKATTLHAMKDLSFTNYRFTYGEPKSTYDYNDTKLFTIYDKGRKKSTNPNIRMFTRRSDYTTSLSDYYNHKYTYSNGGVSGSHKPSEITMLFGVASNLNKEENHLGLSNGEDWKISFDVNGHKYTNYKIVDGNIVLTDIREIGENYKQPIIDCDASIWSSQSTITEVR